MHGTEATINIRTSLHECVHYFDSCKMLWVVFARLKHYGGLARVYVEHERHVN